MTRYFYETFSRHGTFMAKSDSEAVAVARQTFGMNLQKLVKDVHHEGQSWAVPQVVWPEPQ